MLIEHVRACALRRPMLFCVDGLSAYGTAIRAVFRDPVRTGTPGRLRRLPWEDMHIAQVVKRYAKRRVVAVERRIAQGAQHILTRPSFRNGAGGFPSPS